MEKYQKRTLVLGAFGYRDNRPSGQTEKTRNVLTLLNMYMEQDALEYFDTQAVKYNKFSLFLLIRKLWKCEILVYLPAQNSLKFLFPCVYMLSKLRGFSILYILIGGWLADYLKNKPFLTHMLRNIARIYPENQLLKERLHYEYLINESKIIVFPNFRISSFIPSLEVSKDKLLKVVFMARIHHMKGYHLIFQLAGYCIQNNLSVKIDFYGPVNEDDKKDFLDLVTKYSNVSYNGVLLSDQIHPTLSSYDISLLPTKYYTEGFPGSILDSYMAGVPVIATNWLHAAEFIEEGRTGYIIPFENGGDELIKRVVEIYNDRPKLKNLKLLAFRKSQKYTASQVWQVIEENFA